MLLVWGSVLPILLLALYAIAVINSLYRQYDRSVRSITSMNAFNSVFEEELNRSMYYIITETVSLNDLEEIRDKRNPYVLIREFRDELDVLRESAVDADIRNDIDAIERMLSSLTKRIDDIVENVRAGGHYDENMELLRSNIYVLTNLIQKDIGDYIYLETVAMENTRREIELRIQTTVMLLAVGVAIFTAGSLLVSAHLSRKITEPIRDMCRATEQVAGGDFSVRFSLGSGDEIETLARSRPSVCFLHCPCSSGLLSAKAMTGLPLRKRRAIYGVIWKYRNSAMRIYWITKYGFRTA